MNNDIIIIWFAVIYGACGLFFAEACARSKDPRVTWGVFAAVAVFWLPAIIGLAFAKDKT